METLTIIYLILGSIVPNTFFKCGDVGWVYVHSAKTAYVCELNDWLTKFYLSHETAHYHWYNTLSEEQRVNYTKEYNKDYKKWIKYFYREYSMSSVEEDFADNYALIVMKVKINNIWKKRLYLIRKYIKYGK